MKIIENQPSIKYLYLSGNKIKSVESLGILKNYEKLKEIDVSGCPFTEKDGYQFKLFGICKSLMIVDG